MDTEDRKEFEDESFSKLLTSRVFKKNVSYTFRAAVFADRINRTFRKFPKEPVCKKNLNANGLMNY